ncbi:hypothetical protein [Kordia sp.]|uniref:hypothetical protein n=1 Tax=Kordia sp. TaxID=1965332 RepID=UPI0025BE2216|nr:hypothetical protein [Kordia sp.]MCH2194905.1 hypothetical protein [Kordia sp.]
MFWKKKKKLPITEEDKIWVDEALLWLQNDFGSEHFANIRTVTPTKDFYDKKFDHSEKDAEFVLERTMELMNIYDVEIKLAYFSDGPVDMDDGTPLSTPADIYGNWQSAAGTYEKDSDETIISIERRQLKNTVSLIATISHELAHQILLGENRINENDEYLTDLTAIAYGFGIFLGNTRFNFTSGTMAGGFGWEMSSQGYLPEQIIAYAMAKLSHMRNEPTNYRQYLTKSLQKYFKQSEAYLLQNNS